MTMRDSIVALMTDVCTFREDLKMAEMKIDNMLQELKNIAHACGLNPKQLMEQVETGEEEDLDEEEDEDDEDLVEDSENGWVIATTFQGPCTSLFYFRGKPNKKVHGFKRFWSDKESDANIFETKSDARPELEAANEAIAKFHLPEGYSEPYICEAGLDGSDEDDDPRPKPKFRFVITARRPTKPKKGVKTSKGFYYLRKHR